jgi:hypothetical protein
MVFYIGKGLQIAGLVGVGVALFAGMVHETQGAMVKELGGAALGFALFWAGRLLEAR